MSAAPDFWNDAKEAEKFLKKLSGLKYWVEALQSLERSIEDLEVL